MASRKEYEMLFQLNAQLGSSYTSTFKNAQSSITSMQNEIAALSKIQSDISSYQKQQDAVERTRQKLGVLQQQYDNIQKEIQETGTFSSNLENKLLAKQLQIDKTAASLDNQTQKLEAMGVRLRDAGIDVGNLTEESSRLTSEMEQLKESQVEAADEAANFGTTASQAFAAAGQALVAAGITVALKEIYEWFGSAVQASVEFESAMTGVAKTTDMSSEELAAMAREIRLLSTEIPITTTEFAAIAEVAGQLGIAKENLLDFSTTMAMLATATTMTAEEAATLLAQFANITQMDSAYYSNLASTIVELGNNFATTEQKITQMAQGIAAAGSLAGMSEADMVALSAAVTSLGIETQAGASSMSRLIQQLNTAVETGDQLEEFASIAGMTGEEFKKAWGEDAVRALEAFVIGLADTERNGKSANVALQELGITEIRMQRMILSLANSGDLLNRTIETANKAWEENTALVTEAELRYGTTESQLTLMQNAYNNLKIVIGDQFTPELRKLYALQTDVLKTVTDYLEQNPELIKAVTTFVGVIGIAVGGLTGYVAITKLATVVSTAFAAAIPGVNVIMGVAVAIAGLTAGIVALNEASNKYVDESWSLTAASRMQYQRIQELTAEYEKAVETYGETSYEAQSLKWKLEELTTEYELSKQKLVEYKAAHEALVKSYVEMTESHAKATEEIEKEQLSTLALIAKLEELTATTDSATENQQAILGVIKALNRQMPELALNYEDVTQSSKGYIESLKAMAQAQAEQARLEAQWAEYIDRVGQQESLRAAKEAAELNAQLAQEEYDLALKAYNEALDLYKWDPTGVSGWFGTLDEAKVLNVAKEQLELYNSVLEETTLLYEENSAAIAELEEAFNAYQKSQEEGIATGENLAEVINDVRARMKELATAYQEAYDAAMESISGQYKLWDEAAEVVAKSAGEINYALATQAQYWADYRTNLESLTARSEDIEGLSELLATFADGSEESVNVIAGLAMATDSELRAMVANWQAVKAEQEIVAQSLAQLQTDFAAAMSALQQELEIAIGEMNLTEEAAESGKSTIEGFVQGAEDMLPAVREAYARIAKAAIEAIDAQLQIESPSRVFAERGRFAMSGFVDGVSSMESEILKTLSQIAADGVGALSVEAEVSQEASYPERVSLDAVMPAGITEIPRTWVESQAKLASLVEREAHIENMSEFLASLADSGRSSFDVIAGLSVVSEELGSVLSNWRAIQTDFAAAVSALQQELETVIGEMNLTEEAAESGKNTIEGFIQGSEDMLPAVREAYERIAKAAIAAIDARLQIESPSRVFAERGRLAMSGFVDGVSSMESEVLKTLSQIASDGVGALSVEAEVSQEASYPERVSLDAVMPAGITEIPRTWVESQAKLASLVEREAHIENMSEFLASLADSGRSSFNVIAGLSVVSEELGSVLSNWRAIQTNQEMVVADWARLGTDVKSVIEAVRAEGIGGSDAVFAAMATPVTQETGVVARNDALRPIQVVSAQTAPAPSGVRIPPIQITYNITGVSNVEELEDALRARDVELKRTLMDILEEIQIERERGAYV